MPRDHLPLRPLWLCRVCADPWPCANARLSLKAEYAQDRTALCVYLGSMLYDACEDLTKLNPNEVDVAALYTRFIGWPDRFRRRD
ncbi:hypothetical protein [Micromonospora sp. NPDC005299]|uniref:hypothetical protein n=1 Tax=Micromonospora sp. NPDC005299 TaxID=3364231 RepID=UPI0036906A79